MKTISQEEYEKKYGVTSTTPQRKSFLGDAVNDVKGIGSDIISSAKNRASNVGRAQEAQAKGEQGDIRTFLQSAGQAAGFGSDVLASIVKGGVKAVLPQQAEDKLKAELQKAGVAVMSTDTAQTLLSKYESLDEKTKRDVGSATGLTALLLDVVGGGFVGKGAKQVAPTIKSTVSQGVETLAKQGDNLLTPVKQKIGNLTEELPSKIMQRVARIPKGAQANFEQISGESIGKYLTTRGIYGNTDEIASKLYGRFIQSKNLADSELAKLKGSFSPTPVRTMVDDLLARELRVSSPDAPSRILNKVNELASKQAWTMDEINAIKRLYEGNVKVDYLRTVNPEGVARATNLDSAVRNWQFNQAETLGLKNLPQINKETQLAKNLMDSLGKEYAGSAGNNAISLTDWIVLSGGDPTAISAFLVKKGFSSKEIQSAIARFISRGPKQQTPVKADVGATKVLNLPPASGNIRSSVSSGAPIKVAPVGSKIEITSKTGITPSKPTTPPDPKILKSPSPKSTTKPSPQSSLDPKNYKSAEDFVKAKNSEYVYHTTTKGGVEGIVEKGMTKDVADIYQHGELPEDTIGKMIYFADNEKALSNVGTFKQGQVLRIKKVALNPEKMIDRTKFNRVETRYWGSDLTPAEIEIKTGNGWKNLLDYAEENGLLEDLKKNNFKWDKKVEPWVTKSQLTEIWNKANNK